MFPGDSWETESGRELFAAAPNSFVVHNSDSCQLTFDLACLLRPSQQQSDGLQPLSQQLPVESAHRRRSQSALEAEFSGTATEEQLAGCGEVTDSAFYARWLHVKAGCLEDAKQAILNHCTWRASTSPGGIKEADISNELAADKVFLPGADCQGRPVILVLACRHQMRHRQLDETVRLIIYTLDNSAPLADTARNPLGQTLCLIDLSGLRMGNLDIEGLKALFDLLQRHYPERLAELWFLKAPFIFWGLWRVVSPFLHEGTRRKIRFMSSFDELQSSMRPEVLPERYGGQAQLVSLAESVAARRAGEAAAAHEQAKRQEAAQATAAPGGPVTSRLSAAGSTVKRWGASGAGFLAAKVAAAGRQTARPFSAVLAAYRRRQAAAPSRDGPPSPALSTQLSANLDAAKAKARSIGAGMQHANRVVAEYALDGKGHMRKLLHLPSILVCMLQKARRALRWAWGHARRLAQHPDSLEQEACQLQPKTALPASGRIAASAPLSVPMSLFASESQQSATADASPPRQTSPLLGGGESSTANPTQSQKLQSSASNDLACSQRQAAISKGGAADAQGQPCQDNANRCKSVKTRTLNFSEIQPCPREDATHANGAASANLPGEHVQEGGIRLPFAASSGSHAASKADLGADTGRHQTADAQPSQVDQDGQLASSGQMSCRTQDMIAESGVVGNKLPPTLFQPVSTNDLGGLWSRCRDVAGCAGQK